MMTIPRRGHTCGYSTAYLHLSRLISPQVCISSSPLLPQMPASNPQRDNLCLSRPSATSQGLDGIIGSRGGDLPTRPPSPALQFRSPVGKKQEPARLGLNVVTAPFLIPHPRMAKSLIDKDILKKIQGDRSLVLCNRPLFPFS